jgi:hypothetical protein
MENSFQLRIDFVLSLQSAEEQVTGSLHVNLHAAMGSSIFAPLILGECYSLRLELSVQ